MLNCRIKYAQKKLLGACVSFCFCLLPPVAAGAQQPRELDITLDPAKTTIRWTLGDVLHTVNGTFKLKSGSVHLDLQTGVMTGLIVVDATSGESGNSARDRQMHQKILESPRYQTITFRPAHLKGSFDPTKNQTLTVDGIFNLHGQDHPLQLVVNVHPHSNEMSLATHFDVPYVQWGLKDPSTFILRVDKDVSINIEATGQAKQ